MKDTEKIPVFIRIENGKTVCVCHATRKKCARPCERDTVTRDKFEGWKATMKRDQYGR